MGHESQIELWSPLDRGSALLVSEQTRLRCEEAMKTAGRENPNRWATVSSNRAPGAGRSEQILLIEVGCEARKLPAGAEVFFLDFPFYRTNQELAVDCLASLVRQGFLSLYLLASAIVPRLWDTPP